MKTLQLCISTFLSRFHLAIGRCLRISPLLAVVSLRTSIAIVLACQHPALAESEANAKKTLAVESIDRIWYGPAAVRGRDIWDLPEGLYFEGKIQEFDALRLVYLDDMGRKRELESQRVERVDVSWSSAQARLVHQMYLDRKYGAIAGLINSALASGIPHWQQKMLVAELVEAADALGNTRSAGGFFLKYLAEASPPPLLYATMPLCWTSGEADSALLTEAGKWLSSSKEPESLLGASWLLNGTRAEEAKQRLGKLKTSTNKVISQFAAVQLWRLVPPPETNSNLSSWFDFRDSLLRPLQIGPTEFLADRLGRISSADLAVGEWTRIATVHADRYHRATIALSAARAILIRENRQLEAERYAAWIEQLKEKSPSAP